MKTTTQYVHSSDTGVRTREGYAGIAYSDGAEIEERLLRNVVACMDVSDGSAELRRCIVDWPSEYHFSPLRANLLRPFSFANQRVLELGCGCGALTRFLGESGADVVAVEGSTRRAAIAASRCRDLPKVDIYCDNLADFNPASHFDAVTLIGVLEYSRLFVSGEDPVQSCLESAHDYLKDDGVLYLAIENQLGLKYFNGCGEDHTGIPYFGITDRYAADTPVTFGRKELAQRLHAAGFAEVEFFFPFPDYKLPELLLSERAIAHPSLRVGDLLSRVSSRDYGGTPLLSFNESLAWQTISRNGLAGELANSFLVRATRKPGRRPENWLAHTYSAGRLREFATENAIYEEQGRLTVAKRCLFPMPTEPSRFEHVTGTVNYVTGDLYLVRLQRILANGGGIADIAHWARPWLEFLRARVDEDGLLPGEYVDCIPTNLVRDQNGQFHYIDVEWRATSSIPLPWVAVRGLVLSIGHCSPSRSLGKMSYGHFAATVLGQAGLSISNADWPDMAQWEDALRSCTYGAFRDPINFAERLAHTDIQRTAYPTSGETLMQAEAEIKRIKSTFSWHVTKPLRFAYNMLRRLGR
jgi:SAM-dependent methyltransferase